MKKSMLHASKKLLLIGVIAMISIVAYAKCKEPTIRYNEVLTTQELEGYVYTSELAFEQSRQIGKVFGYENMWSFTYLRDQSPSFIKKSEDESWFSSSAKSVGQPLLGKTYSIELSNYFMLGYDFSTLEKEDVTYVEENQTLSIQLPALELTYTPDYAETDFTSSVGLFRLDFSEEEKHNMYEESIYMGIDNFTKETAEIQKGHNYTQESIKELLFAIPEFSEHVKEIEFVHIADEIIVSIDAYKQEVANK